MAKYEVKYKGWLGVKGWDDYYYSKCGEWWRDSPHGEGGLERGII